MPSLLPRPSASMRDPFGSRGATLRSCPPSVRSFVSPPARSEPYPCTVRQQYIKDETAIFSTLEPTAPYRELRLKTVKQNPSGSGCFSTVDPSTRLSVTSSSTTSKPKPTTLSSGPAFQASKRPTVLGETSRRGTILPKVGSTPPFDPEQLPSNQKCKDVFHDAECNSPPWQLEAPSKAFSPHTPPAKPPANDPSPKTAPQHGRTRSALRLPSCRLKRGARSVSKSVTLDPSIVFVGPEVHFNLENPLKEDQKKMQINGAPKQIPAHKIDVKNCVEAIKEWGRMDRSKPMSLIEALKQLELVANLRGGMVKIRSQVITMTES